MYASIRPIQRGESADTMLPITEKTEPVMLGKSLTTKYIMYSNVAVNTMKKVSLMKDLSFINCRNLFMLIPPNINSII